jgi:hypothetical protein
VTGGCRPGRRARAAAWLAGAAALGLAVAASAQEPPAPAAPPARIAPAGPRPTVTARLTPAEVTVGDRVRVELDVALPPGAVDAPALPPGLRRWGAAEVLAAGEAQKLPGEGHYRFHLLLTSFRPGDVTLPPLPIAAAAPPRDDGAATEPLRLQTPEGLGFAVRSVLPAGGEATPMPPARPQGLPLGSAFWWAAGGLLAAVALAAAALAWRWRNLPAPTAEAAPALAPLPALLRDLAALRAEPSPELAHTGLSLALRRFLAATLGFAAAERTTTEIDRELRRGPLATATRRALVELLRRCDEVKFARRPATAAEAAERLDAAAGAAGQVSAELAPPPAPAAEGTAA